MFYMTNTQHKFIIIGLICNIHTVLLIYVINFTNYNNIISYLGAIKSWPFHRSFSNEIQYGGRERVKLYSYFHCYHVTIVPCTSNHVKTGH